MTKTLTLALVLGAASIAAAQEAAAPAQAKTAATSPRIAVIDMGRVSSESVMGKGYAAKLESLKGEIDAEGTKKQTELQKLDAAIKAQQDELEKQGSVLSPDAVEKKRQEIVRKTRERQAYLEDGQQELQRMRERAQQQAQALNAEFQQKIKPHIEAVAKEKGIDILLDSQVVLTLNNVYDISKDVIARADDGEKTAKAATPPAAKPSPSPTPKS
jgi:Skp family chaperone for outer membrane proteins